MAASLFRQRWVNSVSIVVYADDFDLLGCVGHLQAQYWPSLTHSGRDKMATISQTPFFKHISIDE